MSAAAWATVIDWIGRGLLVVLGALATGVGAVISDRRSEKREAAAREERRAERRYDLGRDHAFELINLSRTAWDELDDRLGTAPIQSIDPRQFARKADLVPDLNIRKAGDALARLLGNPEAFEEREAFVRFSLPKGPAGIPPTIVKQILALESFMNMLNAFVREEDVAKFRNPLIDVVMEESSHMGLTVLNLYGQG